MSSKDIDSDCSSTPHWVNELGLLPKRVAAEKILAQVGDRVVQSLAGVARFESQLPCCLIAVQVPEVLGHLHRARLNRRSKVPLLENGIHDL